jgi:hypothetical protein
VQKVGDERGGEALLVRVCRDDPLDRLDQVEPEEESSVTLQPARHRSEQHRSILGIESADRRAEEDDERPLIPAR